MDMMIQFKIAELKKKDELTVITMFDSKSQRWDAAVIKCNPENLNFKTLHTGGYKVVYALDSYKYENMEDAKFELDQMIETLMRTIKTMSN
jgi:hypothetical protein